MNLGTIKQEIYFSINGIGKSCYNKVLRPIYSVWALLLFLFLIFLLSICWFIANSFLTIIWLIHEPTLVTTKHFEEDAAQGPEISLRAISLVNQLRCKIFFCTPHLTYSATDNKMVEEGLRRRQFYILKNQLWKIHVVSARKYDRQL